MREIVYTAIEGWGGLGLPREIAPFITRSKDTIIEGGGFSGDDII